MLHYLNIFQTKWCFNQKRDMLNLHLCYNRTLLNQVTRSFSGYIIYLIEIE